MSKTIAIIPARAGSKGIPDKNLTDFCGQPLLAWTLRQAQKATCIDHIYVSSDCQDILSLAKDYNATPILRPDSLSTDFSSSEDALTHALSYIDTPPDNIIFLQATSPLRLQDDIDNAFNLFIQNNHDSLFSANLCSDLCLWEQKGGSLTSLNFSHTDRGIRQDRDPIYNDNGSIYIFKRTVLEQYNNRIGQSPGIYQMPLWQSFEIDTYEDLDVCRFYFQERIKKSFVDPNLLKSIQLIVYDFDGVMTNNCAIITPGNNESVSVNRSDGMAINKFKSLGLKQLILTAETHSLVQERAQKLDLPIISGCKTKKATLLQYCNDNNIDPQNVCYVGNDLNDLEVMQSLPLRVAPCDAYPPIKAIADIVTQAPGGNGVIRELYDSFVPLYSQVPS